MLPDHLSRMIRSPLQAGAQAAAARLVVPTEGPQCVTHRHRHIAQPAFSVSAPFGGSDQSSFDPLANTLTRYGITITNLAAGAYSFTLATTQEANVTRVARVPEPGMLALLGIGLLGLGMSARRKKLV